MWNPFRKKIVQPRDEAGKFAAPARMAPAKQAQDEAVGMDAFAKMTNSMTSAVAAMDKFNETMASRMQPDEMDVEPESDGIASLLGQLMPYLGPALAPYVGPLIEKYAGVQPSAGGFQTLSPPVEAAPAPESPNITTLITMAAKAPDAALKVAMPALREELRTRGIDAGEFKSACQKLGKVL